MKNGKANIATKMATTVIEFFFETLGQLLVMFQIGLGIRKTPYKGTSIASSSVTMAFSSFTTAMLTGSHTIWGGCQYFFYSLQKWIAIILASDGDWNHWMTGGLYETFEWLKADLIANNSFASFLNDLASQGIFLKLIQISLIFFCVLAIVLPFVVFICSAYHFIYYLITPAKKLQHPKVVKYRKRRSRNYHRP